MPTYQTKASSYRYEDPWMKVRQDRIVTPEGTETTYGVIERQHGVAAVVESENSYLLVREFRYPTQSYEWKVPGGGIDKGETAIDAVIREVAEETGIILQTPELLTTVHPLSSCSTEQITLFYANQFSGELKQNLASEELISDIVFMPASEILQKIYAGEITNPLTVMGILMKVHQTNHL